MPAAQHLNQILVLRFSFFNHELSELFAQSICTIRRAFQIYTTCRNMSTNLNNMLCTNVQHEKHYAIRIFDASTGLTYQVNGHITQVAGKISAVKFDSLITYHMKIKEIRVLKIFFKITLKHTRKGTAAVDFWLKYLMNN